MEKTKGKFDIKKIIKIIILLYVLILCTTWALTMGYNDAPDEAMKYDVCKYLAEHKTLPHGGDEEIREINWGISYAFTPIFSYILSTICMLITSIFTDGPFKIFLSTRIISIICMCGYVFMNIKISEKLFKNIYKWLYVVFVSFLPQIVFLGSYLNNDSLALFSVTIIVYSWILGIENNWNWKSCIILAIGISICALSYYNAYGYILCSIILYFASNWIKKIDVKTFLKKGFAIAGIVLVLAGWWFIRNFIIYDGDIFGLKTSNEYAETYAIDWLKPSNRATPAHRGISLGFMLSDMKWFEKTYHSFIGLFGNMTVAMDDNMYTAYSTIFIIGIIGLVLEIIVSIIKKIRNRKTKEITDKEKIKNKEKILFNIIMVICLIIPILLSLYYSYFSDFQPQGRYIMPMIIPFMYFIVTGYRRIFNIIKNKKIRNVILFILIIIWSIAPIYIYFEYIRKFLYFKI